MEKLSAAALEPAAVNVPTFCLLNNIPPPKLYRLWSKGLGPDVMNIEGTILIGREARIRWRQKMESITQQPGKMKAEQGGSR
jgi:hypothetical protein